MIKNIQIIFTVDKIPDNEEAMILQTNMSCSILGAFTLDELRYYYNAIVSEFCNELSDNFADASLEAINNDNKQQN